MSGNVTGGIFPPEVQNAMKVLQEYADKVSGAAQEGEGASVEVGTTNQTSLAEPGTGETGTTETTEEAAGAGTGSSDAFEPGSFMVPEASAIMPDTTGPSSDPIVDAQAGAAVANIDINTLDMSKPIPVASYQGASAEGKDCQVEQVTADTSATYMMGAALPDIAAGTVPGGAEKNREIRSNRLAWQLISGELDPSDCSTRAVKQEALTVWESVGRAYQDQGLFPVIQEGGMIPVANGVTVGDLRPLVQIVQQAAAAGNVQADALTHALKALLAPGPKDVEHLLGAFSSALDAGELDRLGFDTWRESLLAEAAHKVALMRSGGAGDGTIEWARLMIHSGGNPTAVESAIKDVLALEEESGKTLPMILAESGVFTSDEMLARYYYQPIRAYLDTDLDAKRDAKAFAAADARFPKTAPYPAAPVAADHPNAPDFGLQGKSAEENGNKALDMGSMVTPGEKGYGDVTVGDLNQDEAGAAQ
jgi:hypothetical protein